MININEKIIIFIGLIFSLQLIFPQYSYAYGINAEDQKAMIVSGAYLTADIKKNLPQANNRQPTRRMVVAVTAYSSTPDQTDSTPFITANGRHVADGIVATNLLPFGTKVKFPEIFGDKVFSVEDRMNAKYRTNFDIWMATRAEARKFGIHFVTVEIY